MIMKLLLIILVLGLNARTQTVKQITAFNGEIIRFLEYGKPDGKKHPLIIMLHGVGEKGSNIELVKINGLPDIITNAPNAIVLAPQLPLSFGVWPRWYIDELIKYGKTLNVDSSQIILTGLSLGGGSVTDWAGQPGNSLKISALVPVCPACWYSYQDLKNISCSTWAFVGDKDLTVAPQCTTQMSGQIKNLKITVYKDGSHGTAWLMAYKDTSLYRWMFNQYRNVPRDTIVYKPPPEWTDDTIKVISNGKTYIWTTGKGLIENGHFKTGQHVFKNSTDSIMFEVEDTSVKKECNILPTANAGPDIEVKKGITATISASGSTDADGIVKLWKWTKIKGPLYGKISYSTRQTTTLTGLVVGTYVYRLTVWDDKNGFDTDEVTVKVIL